MTSIRPTDPPELQRDKRRVQDVAVRQRLRRAREETVRKDPAVVPQQTIRQKERERTLQQPGRRVDKPERQSGPSEEKQRVIQDSLEDSLDTQGPKRAAALGVAPRMQLTVDLVELLAGSQTTAGRDEIEVSIGGANTTGEQNLVLPDDTVLTTFNVRAETNSGNVDRVTAFWLDPTIGRVAIYGWDSARGEILRAEGQTGRPLPNELNPSLPILMQDGTELILAAATNSGGGADIILDFQFAQTEGGFPIPFT